MTNIISTTWIEGSIAEITKITNVEKLSKFAEDSIFFGKTLSSFQKVSLAKLEGYKVQIAHDFGNRLFDFFPKTSSQIWIHFARKKLKIKILVIMSWLSYTSRQKRTSSFEYSIDSGVETRNFIVWMQPVWMQLRWWSYLWARNVSEKSPAQITSSRRSTLPESAKRRSKNSVD